MKKTYKIDVDCANCANKMEEAARKTEGVQSATVNFMALKMIVEFAEGQDPKAVRSRSAETAKRWRTTAKSTCKRVFQESTPSGGGVFSFPKQLNVY